MIIRRNCDNRQQEQVIGSISACHHRSLESSHCYIQPHANFSQLPSCRTSPLPLPLPLASTAAAVLRNNLCWVVKDVRWAQSELCLCCTLSYQIEITSFWTDGRSEKGKKGGATPTDKMMRFHSIRLLLLHHPQIISRSLVLSLFSRCACPFFFKFWLLLCCYSVCALIINMDEKRDHCEKGGWILEWGENESKREGSCVYVWISIPVRHLLSTLLPSTNK